MNRQVREIPFNIARPVRPPEFFGRRRELSQLKNAVASCVHTMILGPRRIGKTSLLLALGHELTNRDDQRRVLFLDASLGPRALVERLYSEFLPRRAATARDLSPRRALLSVSKAIQQAGSSLVLLLDELDALRDTETLASLRNIASHQANISLVGAGFRIPAVDTDSSPLYNLFQFIRLLGFSPEETFAFLRERLSALGLPPREDFLEEAYRLTGGYPYLLQALGRAIVEARDGRTRTSLTAQDLGAAIQRLSESPFLHDLHDLGLIEKLILRELAVGEGPKSLSDLVRSLNNSIRASSSAAKDLLPISVDASRRALSSLTSRYLVVPENDTFKLPHLLLRDVLRESLDLARLLPSEPPVLAMSFEEKRLPAATDNELSLVLRLDSQTPVEVTGIRLNCPEGVRGRVVSDLPVRLDRVEAVAVVLRASHVGSYSVGVDVDYHFFNRPHTTQTMHSLEFFLAGRVFQRLVSPYVFGVPITEPSLFFGRTEFVVSLLCELRASGEEKRDLALIGRRRIGKTSVLLKLAAAAHGAGFLPVEVDLETVQPKTLRSLQNAILTSAVESLKFHTKGTVAKAALWALWSRQTLARLRFRATYKGVGIEQGDSGQVPWLGKRLKALLRFLDKHVSSVSYVLVLVDEATLLLAFQEPHILSYLRGVIQHKTLKRVNFVIAGTDLLHKLTSKEASPLYNLFQTTRVGALDEASATRLIREPVKGQGVVFADSAVREILDVTSRIPYWVQALCHHIVRVLNENERFDVQDRDVETALSRLLHHQDLSLLEIWNERSEEERIVLAALAESRVPLPLARFQARLQDLLAGFGLTKGKEMIARLEAVGLVEVIDSYIGFSDGILRAWISKNKEAGELAAELARQDQPSPSVGQSVR